MILNPASGGSDDDLRATIETAMQSQGIEFEIQETTPERDAGTIAREAKAAGVSEIIVCGGDGTVMAAVNGLGPQADVTLGIVPSGTANLIAAGLGLPKDAGEAVAVALSGEVRTIDLGRCGETLFALGMGLGLTERFVTETRPEVKAVLGRGVYLWSLVKELGAKPHRFALTLDGGETIQDRGVALVIANIGSLGGGMRFAPDAKADDGVLDVCVLRRFNLGDAVRLLGSLVSGNLEKNRVLAFYQAKRVEFTAAPPLAAQLDGDAVDVETPIIAEILPGALRVRISPKADLGG